MTRFRLPRAPIRGLHTLWFGLVAASVFFLFPLLFAPWVTSVSGAGSTGGWHSYGLRGESVLALSAVSASGKGLFYAQTPSGLWRKTDGSDADGSAADVSGWERIDTGLPHSTLGAPLIAAWQTVPGQPLKIYALAGPDDARQLYRSEDGGATWNWVSPAPGRSQSPALAVLPGAEGNPDVIMIETASGLQRSLDGGATWRPGGIWPQHIASGDVNADVVRQLLVQESEPDRIVAVSQAGGLWLSENGGLSWHIGGLQDLHVTAATLAGTALWAAATGPSATELLHSSDHAVTWDMQALPAQAAPFLYGGIRVVALEPEPGIAGGLFAAMRGGRIFRSIDGGSTWELIGTPGASQVASLALQPDVRSTLYAATDDGIWARAVAPMVPTAAPPATITPPPTIAVDATLTVLAAEPTNTASPTATETPTRTPTATSTASATPTATSTLTATRPPATATRRPSATPRPRQATPTDSPTPVVPTAAPNVPPPVQQPTAAPPAANTPTTAPPGPTPTPSLPR